MNTNSKTNGWTRFAVLAAVSALLAGIVMVMGQEQHPGPAKAATAGVSATQNNTWTGSNSFPYLSVTAGASVDGYLSLDAGGLKLMPSGFYLAQSLNVRGQGFQTIFGDMWGNSLVQSVTGGSAVYFGNGGYAALFGAGSNTFLNDVIAFRPAHFIGDGSMLFYPQTANPPTAAAIGGMVGSVTNHMLVNVGGVLSDYYSDGTTVWSQPLAPSPALGK